MLDHLVYATPDLAASVDELNRRCGVLLSPGGQHVGLGTRNYLADLGDGAFLEVIGPDPGQPDPEHDRPFGVDHLLQPRLLTWAARVEDLDDAVRAAQQQGCDPGPITTMSRDREDGMRLSWRLAVPPDLREFGGLVPFLIDWGGSPGPAATSARGLRLVSFTGFHPDVAKVEQRLAMLGLSADITVEEAPEPALRAVLQTPAGEVELS